MQSQNNQLFESRIPVFTGFFVVLLWFVTLTGFVAADERTDQSVGATVIQVADSGFSPVSSASGAVSKNPGQLLTSDNSTGKATASATVPGSVIALVVALIAVVAVARRDTSGTTQNS